MSSPPTLIMGVWHTYLYLLNSHRSTGLEKKLFCRVASRRRCELGIIIQQFYNEVKKSYHDRAGLASGENAVT